MVEDELAIGVVLLIQWHGSQQRTFCIDGYVSWQPAELFPNTAVFFHGMEKFVAQEGMIILDQPIPLICRNLLDLLVDADLQIVVLA